MPAMSSVATAATSQQSPLSARSLDDSHSRVGKSR